jgi:hypothetical protein
MSVLLMSLETSRGQTIVTENAVKWIYYPKHFIGGN